MGRKNHGSFSINAGALIWVVIGAAMTLRILHVVFTARHNPLASDPALDAANYDRWAKALIGGGDPGPIRLMAAPLYTWFLSLVYRLFGANLTVVRFIQALLGTASCAFIAVITRRLFRSQAAAITAGMAAALYLPSIFYEGLLMPTTIILFLNLLFLICILPKDLSPGPRRLLLAGVVLGLSVTAKPVAILLLPFVVMHLLFVSRGLGTGHMAGKPAPAANPLHAFAKRVVVLVAGIVLSLMPLTIRNARLTGEFIPLTVGGGIAFYIGNNPTATGFYTVPFFKGESIGATPGEQWKRMHRIALAETGRTLSHSEVSRFWLRKGLEYDIENPRRWTGLLWRKFLSFWNSYERANVENITFHRRFPGVLRLPLLVFGIIAPLGLLGIFLKRNRWRDLWLLYGGVLTYLIAALAFYVLSRYRLPVVVYLLPFAGACISELITLARSRRTGELALALAALALLFYFTNFSLAADTSYGVSANLTRLGNVYIARGDTTSAAQAYREAVRINPDNQTARKQLGRLAPP